MQYWEETYFKKFDYSLFMDKNKKQEIQKIKKIFLEDLSYISLALIQKTSF